MSPVCVTSLSQAALPHHLPDDKTPVFYLAGQSHRATMLCTNDRGLKHVSPASVQWIGLIRQGTVQDVVQGPNESRIIE